MAAVLLIVCYTTKRHKGIGGRYIEIYRLQNVLDTLMGFYYGKGDFLLGYVWWVWVGIEEREIGCWGNDKRGGMNKPEQTLK